MSGGRVLTADNAEVSPTPHLRKLALQRGMHGNRLSFLMDENSNIFHDFFLAMLFNRAANGSARSDIIYVGSVSLSSSSAGSHL
jgi:hypothetical protein